MFPKPLKLLVFVVSLSLLLVWIPQALADQVKLAWDATTKHTDGTAASDLAGYRLYSWPGTATPPPSTRVLVYQGQLTTYTDTRTELVAGATYSYAVVAYDTAGKESAYSNVLPVPIASGNRAPSASADTTSATAGTPTTINVLSNDTDLDGNSLTLVPIPAETPTAHGTISSSGNSVMYTPTAGYVGPDSFTYTISDGQGGIATGNVTVTVLAGNQLPVAMNDTILTSVGVPVMITVLANDSDPDGPTPTVVPIPAETQTAHGTISSSGNSVTYTPDPTYVGLDSFTYTISDGQGGTATATVTVTVLPNRAASLVAAYHFDEGSGSSATDVSGHNNTGTISGATWTTSGKFGSALAFNSTNARVTIPDTALLRLATAMTLEAWVYPTVTPTGWRSVIAKNVDGYYLMVSSDQSNRPAAGGTFLAGNQNTYGPATLAVNTWTHLAATFDGVTVRLYVNGVQVASQAQTTALKPTMGTLEIGANSYTGENFVGRIDEVRIYNIVLSLAEIQEDMVTNVQ